MAIRTLSRSVGTTGIGKVVNILTNTLKGTQGPYALKYETLREDVAPGDNHFFSVERYWYDSAVVLNGGHPTQTYQNVPLLPVPDSSIYPVAFPADKGNSYYATQLMAMTNPSRPTVDVPVFVAELKDLPDLVKIVGDNAIKTVAKANLAYWFGWKPLLSDILKMLDFSTVVNNRYKELKRLYDGGLRCTRDLDNSSIYNPHTTVSTLNGDPSCKVQVYFDQTCTMKVWGHVKWKPTTLPPKTDEEMISLARKAAFGLTIDPATAWELIPFSWLADWFGDIGAFLQAYRNIVPAVSSDLTIMRHKQCTTSFTLTQPVNNGGIASLYPGNWEEKSRVPASAGLSAYLPYLTLRQLSILGSLSVTRSGSLRL